MAFVKETTWRRAFGAEPIIEEIEDDNQIATTTTAVAATASANPYQIGYSREMMIKPSNGMMNAFNSTDPLNIGDPEYKIHRQIYNYTWIERVFAYGQLLIIPGILFYIIIKDSNVGLFTKLFALFAILMYLALITLGSAPEIVASKIELVPQTPDHLIPAIRRFVRQVL